MWSVKILQPLHLWRGIPRRLSETGLLTSSTMLVNSPSTCCGQVWTQKALTDSSCSAPPPFTHVKGALSKEIKSLTDPKEDALLSSSCASQLCAPTALHPVEGFVQDLDRRWKVVIQCSRGNVEMEEKRRGKDHHALTFYLTGFTPIS